MKHAGIYRTPSNKGRIRKRAKFRIRAQTQNTNYRSPTQNTEMCALHRSPTAEYHAVELELAKRSIGDRTQKEYG